MSLAVRRADLAANLDQVRARVAAACTAAGRDPAEVTIIAVTKTRPADDVRLLAGLGVLDVGENRDQEAAPKAAACTGLGLRWHFVGRLQSNKARSVAQYAHAVHSVDSAHLVVALQRGADRADRRVGALVQVSLDADPGRGGALPEHVPDLADLVAAAPLLDLLGLMAVAPLDVDPVAAFARLASVVDRVRADHPEARWLSAGMSADLEAAVAAGATHVRVGTALLGGRPPLG